MTRREIIKFRASLLVFLICASSAWGQDSLSVDSLNILSVSDFSFTVEPIIGRHIGHSLYDMNLRDFAEDGTPVRIRSQLIFPLDVPMFGLRASVAGQFMGHRHAQFAASYAQELSDPSDPMEDSDWIGVGGSAAFLFSYTQSTAFISFRQWSLEARLEILQRRKTRMDVLAGLRHQRLVQSVVGYSGWYFDGITKTSVSGDEPAIFYKVSYWLPNVGIGYNIRFSEVTRADITLAYSLVHAWDFDDHLLRYKTAVADGWGHGFLGSFRLERMLGAADRSLRPFLVLGVDYTYIGVSGTQVQRWYGDEEATPDDETGIVISGIPHKFSASELLASVRIGLRF